MEQNLAKTVLICPTHFLRKENIVEYLSEVRSVHRSSRFEIEKYQKKCLCNVISTSLIENSSSAELLRKKIKVINENNICNVISELPLQSKEYLRSIVTKEGRPRGMSVDFRSTSGSTGLPFQFYKDRYATGYMDAVLYESYSWHGIKIGDPQARFWGMPLTSRGACIAKLKDLLKNRVRFSAFDLSDNSKEKYFERILKFVPAYFYGYPSLIVEFVKYVSETNKDLKRLKLKAVIGTGEYVYEKERKIIEEITGTKFINEYGCTEVGIIGFECDRGKMHLMASNIYCEVIKDGKRVVDEVGDIYVTELHAKYRPFIRYGIGDRGMILSEICSCGSKLPVLHIISGRKDDYIITPEGNKVYDAVFAYVLKKGIDQFEAVQTDVNTIELNIKVNETFNSHLHDYYKKTLLKNISTTMNININIVDEINRDRSGKLRYFKRQFN